MRRLLVLRIDGGRQGSWTHPQVLLGELPPLRLGAGTAARAGRAAVVTVDRFVAVYPSSGREWVTHLDRLAVDVRGGWLDGKVLVAPLDSVYAAIAYRQRDDQATEPW